MSTSRRSSFQNTNPIEKSKTDVKTLRKQIDTKAIETKALVDKIEQKANAIIGNWEEAENEKYDAQNAENDAKNALMEAQQSAKKAKREPQCVKAGSANTSDSTDEARAQRDVDMTDG